MESLSKIVCVWGRVVRFVGVRCESAKADWMITDYQDQPGALAKKDQRCMVTGMWPPLTLAETIGTRTPSTRRASQ